MNGHRNGIRTYISSETATQQLPIGILLIIVILQNRAQEHNSVSVAVIITSGAKIMSKRLQSEDRISPDVMLASNGLLMFTYLIPSVAHHAYSTYLV